MQDRFKFRAVLKTNTHSIIAEPYYITDNGYFVNIDDVQKPFEKKYPDDCFWEFLEEIEKQENCQEVSTDSEIIIFNSFNGLIQCTGLKDKNGNLIYQDDILGDMYEGLYIHYCEHCHQFQLYSQDYGCMACNGDIHWIEVVEDNKKLEVIGNIYENKELLNEIHS